MIVHRVVDGIVALDNGNLCGQMLIIETGGVRQLHSDNINLSKLSAIRIAKEFLSTVGNIFTAVNIDDDKLKRFLLNNGFVEINVKGNFIILKKD
jgi:hypothetical protein